MKKIDLLSLFIVYLVFVTDISSQENLATNSNSFIDTIDTSIPYEDNLSYGYENGIFASIESLSCGISFFNLDVVNNILVGENFPKLKNVLYGFSPRVGISFKDFSLFLSGNYYPQSYHIGDKKVTYQLLCFGYDFRYNYFLKERLNLTLSLEMMVAEDKLYYVENSGQFLGILDPDNTFLQGQVNFYFNPGIGLEYFYTRDFIIGFRFNHMTRIYESPDYDYSFSSDLSNSYALNIYIRYDFLFYKI